MNANFYLGAMIILGTILAISNIWLITLHPIHMISNLILLAILLFMTVMYGKQKEKEHYDPRWKEPDPYLKGRIFGGTVYTSYPENVPGLGWI